MRAQRDRGRRAASGAPGSVSVVVVNWNGAADLDECLRALGAQTYPGPLDVVVVDNGSTDGSRAVAERYAPRVRLIRNAENRGFAAGSNQGIRASSSEFVALINNDAVADPQWIAELVRVVRTAPDVGSCTSRILSYHAPGTLDNVGHVLFADGLTRGRGRLEKDRGQYDREEEVFCASGCACLWRRAALEDAGLFDERFFAYCEDADLGFRARLLGWRCLLAPRAVVLHKFSASSDAFSAFKAFQVERNRCWLAVKNLPLPLLLPSPLSTLHRYAWQAWGVVVGRGASGRFLDRRSPGSLLLLLLRAWGQAIGGLPWALRQRRIIQSRRKVSTAVVRRWFRDFGIGAREIALLE